MLTHQYQIQFSDDKRTVTLRLLGFKSYARIIWPGGFAAYRIALVIGQLPDMVWNARDKRFMPVIPHMEELSVSTFSDWRACSTDLVDIILTASFAKPALQQPGTTVVVALGIEVSTSSGYSSPINLSGYGTMRIVECFV